MWPIYENTRCRTRIKEGERLVFYIAGAEENSQSFLYSAVAASEVETLWISEPEEWLLPRIKLGLKLRQIRRFRNPVHLKPLLKRMSFIKSSIIKYGAYLQGGCVVIHDSDYEIILEAAGDLLPL